MSLSRKITGLILIMTAILMLSLSAGAQEMITKEETQTDSCDILVVFFSRAGENWDVGYIEKGNTQIVAEMLADALGADLLQIETVMEYPESYDEMLDVATQQREDNERPELKELAVNPEDYQTIFLGYPIWWGGLPMPIYTLLESYDFSGKTIYPFNTHGGSGVAGTDQEIAGIIPGAEVKDGFAVTGKTAQNDPDKAKEQVMAYLEDIGL